MKHNFNDVHCNICILIISNLKRGRMQWVVNTCEYAEVDVR